MAENKLDKLDPDDDDWGGVAVKQGPDLKQRMAELKARAPVKHKKSRPFAMVYLDTAARAYAALNCPKAMLWAWLLHKTRSEGKKTVPVPNGVLAKWGVPRETKRRALRELEGAGLIAVEQRSRKTPLVTIL